MTTDKRLIHEISHGQYILEHGEEIWNWSSPAGKVRWSRRCGLFSDFIGLNNRHQVLEIGCGTGLFTQELSRTGNKITAIDLCEDLIFCAKERVTAPNVHFVTGNACKTEFADASFDYIVGSSSLHHLEVDTALKEFFRILKPGGKILFTEPNMLNPQVALIKNVPYLKRKEGDSPDETAFFRWKIAETFRGHGFSHVEVTPFDFLHPSTPAPLVKSVDRISVLLEKIPLIREFSGSMIIRCQKA
jgi:SAM-dependent methyltransferase